MQKKITLLIALSVVLLSSCEKQDPECFLTAPNLYVNDELYSGKDIKVEVLENESISIGTDLAPGFEYRWTGPNGFESNLANPIINNAGSEDSGTYHLTYSKGICIVETSLNLIVESTVIPCTPQKNKLTFTASVTPMSFYGSYNHNSSGYYTMEMNSSEGDLRVIFSNQSAPESGVYSINQESPTSPGPGEVSVAVNYNGYYGEAREGDVYITKHAEGVYSILFCEFKFYNSFPVELIGSALINQSEL